MKRAASCGCIDRLRPVDSEEELRNTAEVRAAHREMQEILTTTSTTLQRQEDRQAEQLESI